VSVRAERWRVARLVALPLVVGMLLLQTAWILALPAFRGTDEIDHSYRAAEVAAGEWVGHHGEAPDGRGDLVRVPQALVDAARPVCESYDYMGHDNCRSARPLGHGEALAASAAATYNPFYYAVVGTFGKPFDGASAVFAMRVVTALACALLIGAAGWATALWSRTGWPLVGLVVTATPVVVFSSSVTAPNGVEMCAALALWSTLLALLRPESRRHTTPLLVLGAGAAVLLVSLRSIGPLWAVLIILTVLGSRPARDVLLVIRDRLGAGLVRATLAVVIATAASALWTVRHGVPNFEQRPRGITDPITTTLQQYPLWFLQGVAAFPRRLDAAPGVVYVVCALATLSLLVAGFVAAGRRLRWTMAVVAALALAVPFVLTVMTVAETGAIWQGRYGTPYHLGLALLAGLALDERARSRFQTPVLVALWAGLAVAHTASIVHVVHGEELRPSSASVAWAHPSAWLVAALVVAGLAAWAVAVERSPRRPEVVATSRNDERAAVSS
jgi:hypothetical protein